MLKQQFERREQGTGEQGTGEQGAGGRGQGAGEKF